MIAEASRREAIAEGAHRRPVAITSLFAAS
jgi:hypothetical protein